ncbi:MAG: hypothetical protein IPK33_06410 [Gemmatimonadetes bacterium]|nr:hypothetical protein [Gemmatimonadota bacterium]
MCARRGDAKAAAVVGRAVGAVTVMVGTLSVDASESVPGIITGSAVLDARFYDGATGALLGAERFQVGAGGVPGRAGINALDAISQAAESVARQAVRALAQRSGANR